MTANPFADQKNPTTRIFLCCLHNRTDTNEGRRNGLMTIEVYNKMEEGRGPPYAEGADRFWITQSSFNNSNTSGPTENHATSNPSTSSNSQAITPGCGQGTDNSTCQSNQTTQQNTTTTPHPVDCNANPQDPSSPQQNINNNTSQPQEQQPQQHTQTCPDGSVIDVSATCPSTTNNNQSADVGGGNSNYNGSNSTDDSSGSSWDNHHD